MSYRKVEKNYNAEFKSLFQRKYIARFRITISTLTIIGVLVFLLILINPKKIFDKFQKFVEDRPKNVSFHLAIFVVRMIFVFGVCFIFDRLLNKNKFQTKNSNKLFASIWSLRVLQISISLVFLIIALVQCYKPHLEFLNKFLENTSKNHIQEYILCGFLIAIHILTICFAISFKNSKFHIDYYAEELNNLYKERIITCRPFNKKNDELFHYSGKALIESLIDFDGEHLMDGINSLCFCKANELSANKEKIQDDLLKNIIGYNDLNQIINSKIKKIAILIVYKILKSENSENSETYESLSYNIHSALGLNSANKNKDFIAKKFITHLSRSNNLQNRLLDIYNKFYAIKKFVEGENQNQESALSINDKKEFQSDEKKFFSQHTEVVELNDLEEFLKTSK